MNYTYTPLQSYLRHDLCRTAYNILINRNDNNWVVLRDMIRSRNWSCRLQSCLMYPGRTQYLSIIHLVHWIRLAHTRMPWQRVTMIINIALEKSLRNKVVFFNFRCMIFLLNKWGHIEIFATKFVWLFKESDKKPFFVYCWARFPPISEIATCVFALCTSYLPRIPPSNNQRLFPRGPISTAWWIILKAGMDNRVILRIDVPTAGLTIKCIVTKSVESDTELHKAMLTFGLVTPGIRAHVKPRPIRVLNGN